MEITGYTSPCKNIAGSFRDGEFIRISQRLHLNESRVYAKVLETGVIKTGDPISELPA
jgi:MOSC domain-containing protein YiiM